MGPDAVTAEWLSEILDADVASVVQHRIGDGLVGMNLRVELDVASADTDAAPASVVIKLPSLDETSRATGILLRNYEREVKFYNEVADTVDIRVPQCWHGSWDQESGDFVLVLEDMAPAEQGDQIAGCDAGTAHRSVAELAKLHGPRWGDPKLADLEFLGRRTGPDDVSQLLGLWEIFLPGFIDTYSKHLSDDARSLVQTFGERLGAWMDRPAGPTTVTHGDYRLDNLLFESEAGGPPVTAVDWQTPGQGPPIADLAYFCGAGLLPDERREHESALIDTYLMALEPYAVDIDRTWVWEQYRREAFAGVIMAVIASQVVGGSDRSEAMFAAMATRHLQHALDLESIDLIG